MFLLLAFGIAVALPASFKERAEPLTRTGERETALQSIARLEEEQRVLKEQIAALRAQLANAQQAQSAAAVTAAELENALKTQRSLAGLTPRTGPGLRLLLDDSPSAAPAGAAANDYIIHDTDLRDVLYVLWDAGAEAIAINGERLVVTSSVVCVGTVILVNDTRLSPPYEITALGESRRLSSAIEQAAQLAGLRSRVHDVGLQLKLTPAQALETPAYKGTFTLRNMRGAS